MSISINEKFNKNKNMFITKLENIDKKKALEFQDYISLTNQDVYNYRYDESNKKLYIYSKYSIYFSNFRTSLRGQFFNSSFYDNFPDFFKGLIDFLGESDLECIDAYSFKELFKNFITKVYNYYTNCISSLENALYKVFRNSFIFYNIEFLKNNLKVTFYNKQARSKEYHDYIYLYFDYDTKSLKKIDGANFIFDEIKVMKVISPTITKLIDFHNSEDFIPVKNFNNIVLFQNVSINFHYEFHPSLIYKFKDRFSAFISFDFDSIFGENSIFYEFSLINNKLTENIKLKAQSLEFNKEVSGNEQLILSKILIPQFYCDDFKFTCEKESLTNDIDEISNRELLNDKKDNELSIFNKFMKFFMSR